MKALLWLLGFMIGCAFILAKGYGPPRHQHVSFPHNSNTSLPAYNQTLKLVKNTDEQPPFTEEDHTRFKLIILDILSVNN